MAEQTLYEVLGIEELASPEEIKAAWRGKAKRLHPDVSQEDAAAFNKAKHAYDVLSDPERRKLYDETGESTAPRQPQNRARALVMKILEEVVKGIVNADGVDDLVAIDVPARVLASMSQRTAEFHEKYRHLDNRLARAQTLLDRLKVPEGEDDPLRVILAGGLAAMRQERAMVEEAEQAHNEAVRVWQRYGYDWEQFSGLDTGYAHPLHRAGLLAPGSARRFGGYRSLPRPNFRIDGETDEADS